MQNRSAVETGRKSGVWSLEKGNYWREPTDQNDVIGLTADLTPIDGNL